MHKKIEKKLIDKALSGIMVVIFLFLFQLLLIDTVSAQEADMPQTEVFDLLPGEEKAFEEQGVLIFYSDNEEDIQYYDGLPPDVRYDIRLLITAGDQGINTTYDVSYNKDENWGHENSYTRGNILQLPGFRINFIDYNNRSIRLRIEHAGGMCADSDHGLSYYARGKAESGIISTEDTCVFVYDGVSEKIAECVGDDCFVREYFCEAGGISHMEFQCQDGCSNGACIIDNICAEVGEKFDYDGPIEQQIHCCKGLSPFYPGGMKSWYEGFCFDILKGLPACLFSGTDSEGWYYNNNLNESQLIKHAKCPKCITDQKEYPVGYRMPGEFCSDGGTFAPQLEDDAQCNNNFECSSNVCVDGSCISSSLIQKLLAWLERSFG